MQRKFCISFLCIVTKKLDNKLAILDKIKTQLDCNGIIKYNYSKQLYHDMI